MEQHPCRTPIELEMGLLFSGREPAAREKRDERLAPNHEKFPRHASRSWDVQSCAMQGSNLRLLACEASALPLS